MAHRTWSRVLLTALGVAATTGAGQLGFAYGLSIVRLARGFPAGADHPWAGQMAWVGWITMVAAVAGALSAERVAAGAGWRLGLPGRAGLAAVAGLGAGIVAPLTMLQARWADLGPTVDPVLTVGLTAALSAVIGVVAATATLAARPIAWNAAATIAAVWAVALLSVAPSLGPQDLPTVRLAVLDLPALSARTTRTLGLLGIPAVGLLAGVATAGAARLQRRHHPAVVGACGAAGPGMLAIAYLLAGPGGAAAATGPYRGALAGVATGTLGSLLLVLVPVLRRLVDQRLAARRESKASVAPAPIPEDAAPDHATPDDAAPDDAAPDDAAPDDAAPDAAAPDAATPDMSQPADHEDGGRRSVFDRVRRRRAKPPGDTPTTSEAATGAGESPSDPTPAAAEEAERARRFRPRRGKVGGSGDEEYVDWVAGLGTNPRDRSAKD